MKIEDRLRRIVREDLGPVLDRHELSLYDLEFHRGKSSRTLLLFIDGKNGVTLDQCALVSRVLSRILDVEDPISGPYRIEVSSPGLTRRLTKPSHYLRSIGETARFVFRTDHKNLIGRIAALDEALATVTVESADTTESIPIAEIRSARLVLQE